MEPSEDNLEQETVMTATATIESGTKHEAKEGRDAKGRQMKDAGV